jgi:hypothetical protein
VHLWRNSDLCVVGYFSIISQAQMSHPIQEVRRTPKRFIARQAMSGPCPFHKTSPQYSRFHCGLARTPNDSGTPRLSRCSVYALSLVHSSGNYNLGKVDTTQEEE